MINEMALTNTRSLATVTCITLTFRNKKQHVHVHDHTQIHNLHVQLMFKLHCAKLTCT